MQHFFLIFLLAAFISGCSTRGAKTYTHKLTLIKEDTPQEIIYTPNNKNAVSMALYEEYEKWKGVPYRYGGENKNGVDCSSFVQTMYFNALRVRVPRTTSQQQKTGYFIAKNKLREGDLIIFRTTYSSKHSGIYIEKGKFVHASSKYGVTISNVNNPYWREKYSQARRVINY